MDYDKTPLVFAPGANEGDLLTTVRAYEARGVQGWGLCWYYAAAVAERFYTSHGIEPRTILQEGMGFLGIRLVQHPCPGTHGWGAVLGRFSIAGEPVNWAPGTPVIEDGWSREELLEMPADFRLMHLLEKLPLPESDAAHRSNCLHRRRGSAYCLMFRLAALFSMRHDVHSGWSVINEKSAMREMARKLDPKYDDSDETTYFLFRGKHDLLVSGDSRIILPGPLGNYYDFWDRYVLGEHVEDILGTVESAVLYGKLEPDGADLKRQRAKESAKDTDVDHGRFVQRHRVENDWDWNRQLMEVASWRLACELYRRFPRQFSLIECHPGGGGGDCLGLLSKEVTLNINRGGTLHIWDRYYNDLVDALPIWPAMMKTENHKRLLDDICAFARLTPPKSMPPTSSQSLVYRFIAAFLSHAGFGVHYWECRQGCLDTAGEGGGTVKRYFKPFPWASALLQPLPNDRALDNSADFWFLLRDGKPKLVLHTSGWAARPRAKKGVELMPLYVKHGRKVWPVVMEVAGGLLP